MGDHLGVGVALEDAAASGEFGLQFGEVLDDAVVHHRHAAGDVRVGVCVRWRAVGGQRVWPMPVSAIMAWSASTPSSSRNLAGRRRRSSLPSTTAATPAES